MSFISLMGALEIGLIFALVALVYYVICRPLSAYSKRMEQKLLVAAR